MNNDILEAVLLPSARGKCFQKLAISSRSLLKLNYGPDNVPSKISGILKHILCGQVHVRFAIIVPCIPSGTLAGVGRDAVVDHVIPTAVIVIPACVYMAVCGGGGGLPDNTITDVHYMSR